MKIRLHPHAKDRAAERGATEAGVIAGISLLMDYGRGGRIKKTD
jgi:hypothetical protein